MLLIVTDIQLCREPSQRSTSATGGMTHGGNTEHVFQCAGRDKSLDPPSDSVHRLKRTGEKNTTEVADALAKPNGD